jgi:hypothetical protein
MGGLGSLGQALCQLKRWLLRFLACSDSVRHVRGLHAAPTCTHSRAARGVRRRVDCALCTGRHAEGVRGKPALKAAQVCDPTCALCAHSQQRPPSCARCPCTHVRGNMDAC